LMNRFYWPARLKTSASLSSGQFDGGRQNERLSNILSVDVKKRETTGAFRAAIVYVDLHLIGSFGIIRLKLNFVAVADIQVGAPAAGGIMAGERKSVRYTACSLS